MTKKTDTQGFIHRMTPEKIEHLANETIGRAVPLLIMRDPPVSCSAIDIVPFNDREMISIKALIAWAAMENRIPEHTVESWLTTWADVKNVNEIERNRYDDVIKFLVDFNVQVN